MTITMEVVVAGHIVVVVAVPLESTRVIVVMASVMPMAMATSITTVIATIVTTVAGTKSNAHSGRSIARIMMAVVAALHVTTVGAGTASESVARDHEGHSAHYGSSK